MMSKLSKYLNEQQQQKKNLNAQKNEQTSFCSKFAQKLKDGDESVIQEVLEIFKRFVFGSS